MAASMAILCKRSISVSNSLSVFYIIIIIFFEERKRGYIKDMDRITYRNRWLTYIAIDAAIFKFA